MSSQLIFTTLDDQYALGLKESFGYVTVFQLMRELRPRYDNQIGNKVNRIIFSTAQLQSFPAQHRIKLIMDDGDVIETILGDLQFQMLKKIFPDN